MPRPSPSYAYDPILVALGEAIRSARKERGMSQEELAARAGVDRAYVSGIERGEHNVAIMNVAKIVAALGMTVAEMMGRAGV